MIVHQEKTIGELVADAPLRANVFEKRKIDYCCNGRRTLKEVCAEQNIPMEDLLAELETQPRLESAANWQDEPLDELVHHIVRRHHGYLRETLPSTALKLEKVVRAHGTKHDFLAELQQVFGWLSNELTSHMAKEETVLFPHISAMEAALRNNSSAPPAPGGTVRNPISRMEHEHDDVGLALGGIRAITSGYEPPQGACNTFRALCAQLAQLECDLHTHIHLENNILFPRAAALEDSARG
jgi:regulator of cell morphogenesis and NO signaling